MRLTVNRLHSADTLKLHSAAAVEQQTERPLEKDWPGSYSPELSVFGLVGEPDVVH